LGWYARLGSNQRLPAPEAGALSTELRAQFLARGHVYRQIIHRGRYVKGDIRIARPDGDEMKELIFTQKAGLFLKKFFGFSDHIKRSCDTDRIIGRSVFNGMFDGFADIRNDADV
jgi:hypothetical protein